MATYFFNSPPLKTTTAMINSGRFKGRKVEILPEDYLDERYCLTRDLEFGIELSMRKDELGPWIKEVHPKVKPHKRKEVKKMGRSAPCFEYEVAVMDSPNLTSQAKVMYGSLRRLRKKGDAKVVFKEAVKISGLAIPIAKKAEKQLVSLGVIGMDNGLYAFTLQKEGSSEQAAALENLKKGPSK